MKIYFHDGHGLHPAPDIITALTRTEAAIETLSRSGERDRHAKIGKVAIYDMPGPDLSSPDEGICLFVATPAPTGLAPEEEPAAPPRDYEMRPPKAQIPPAEDRGNTPTTLREDIVMVLAIYGALSIVARFVDIVLAIFG